MLNVQLSCFLTSYVVAFALELMRLLRRGPIHRGVMLAFAWAGFAAHTLFIVARSRAANLPPLLSSSQDWMLVLAWLAALLYLLVATFDRDIAIGLFLLPLVVLLISAAVFFSERPNAHVQDLTRQWVMLHVILMVFGVFSVLVCLVCGLMYLLQHWRLRRKTVLGTGLTLSSLERLARLNWWSIIVSVPLLTGGLLSGVKLGYMFEADQQVFSFMDPIVILYGVVWTVMAALFFWLVSTPRAAGKQVASLTIWACSFMLVTLVTMGVLARGGGVETFHGPATEISNPG